MCGVVRLFGRRVHSSIPLTSVTAAADFGLNAGFSRGPRLPLLESGDTRPVPLSIQMDDEMLCREPLRILDGGVRSALWLASELSDRGRCIEAGMKVIAEACTPIYQVTAGRMATVVFGDAEPMVVRYR
jgi:2-keto-4-pentenoate hydratase